MLRRIDEVLAEHTVLEQLLPKQPQHTFGISLPDTLKVSHMQQRFVHSFSNVYTHLRTKSWGWINGAGCAEDVDSLVRDGEVLRGRRE